MIVAHLDLDAFFAAVEELENPSLRTVPLIVGGDPHGRGVVATANYVARSFGIHSAMSAAEALRRCPHAVFVRPRHSLYRDYSREVWSTVREIVPAVEQAGIDEGYLDLGGSRGRSTTRAQSPRLFERPSERAPTCPARSALRPRRSSPRSPPTGGSRAASPSCGRAARRRSSRRSRSGCSRASDPKAEERLHAFGIETIGQLAAIGDDDLTGVLRGRSDGTARPCTWDRSTAARGSRRADLDLDRRRRSRATSQTRSGSTTSCGGWPSSWPGIWSARGQVAAHRDDEGALPRLRDPDPGRRLSPSGPTTPTASAGSPAGSSTARSATGPRRSGWSVSASRGSTSTSNFRSRHSSELLPRSRRKSPFRSARIPPIELPLEMSDGRASDSSDAPACREEVHVVLQRAGVPYEVERQVCAGCSHSSSSGRSSAQQPRHGSERRTCRRVDDELGARVVGRRVAVHDRELAALSQRLLGEPGDGPHLERRTDDEQQCGRRASSAAATIAASAGAHRT